VKWFYQARERKENPPRRTKDKEFTKEIFSVLSGGTRRDEFIPSFIRRVHSMATDPVCKMKVDEANAAGQTNYNGKDYYFCSKDCEQKFEHDPQQYVEAAA
jgi:YHS domain-containing protein